VGWDKIEARMAEIREKQRRKEAEVPTPTPQQVKELEE